ncbi:hypothetical protein GQ457_12G021090 [Hibiscus cannabinus]
MAATVLECIKRNGLVNSEDIMAMQRALQTEECVSDDEALCLMNWDKLLKIWGVGSVPKSKLPVSRSHWGSMMRPFMLWQV